MVKDIQLETERLILRMIRLKILRLRRAGRGSGNNALPGRQNLGPPGSWRHMCAMVGTGTSAVMEFWAVEEKATGQFIGRSASLSGNMAGIRTWLDGRSCGPGKGIRDGSCAAGAGICVC
jgi:hypothetical protein